MTKDSTQQLVEPAGALGTRILGFEPQHQNQYETICNSRDWTMKCQIADGSNHEETGSCPVLASDV